LYHKRNVQDAQDLVFFFSDILQRRVATLAAQYPIMENSQRVHDRSIDEFTENSILSDIHKKIDSTFSRIIEMITSSAVGKTSKQADPILGQIQNTGITFVLVLQLIIVAIVIFIVAFASENAIFRMKDVTPIASNSMSVPIDQFLVPVLNYLPLKDWTNSGPVPTDALGQTIPGISESTTTPTDVSSTTALTDITVQSATRG